MTNYLDQNMTDNNGIKNDVFLSNNFRKQSNFQHFNRGSEAYYYVTETIAQNCL